MEQHFNPEGARERIPPPSVTEGTTPKKALNPGAHNTALNEYARLLITWGVVPLSSGTPETASYSDLSEKVARQVREINAVLPSARVVRHLFFSSQLCSDTDAQAFDQVYRVSSLLTRFGVARDLSTFINQTLKSTRTADSLEAAIADRSVEELEQSRATRRAIHPSYALEHELVFQLSLAMRSFHDSHNVTGVLFGLAAALDETLSQGSDRKFLRDFTAASLTRRELFSGGAARPFDIFWTWVEPTPWGVEQKPSKVPLRAEKLVSEILALTREHGEVPQAIRNLSESSIIFLCSYLDHVPQVEFIERLSTEAARHRHGLASPKLMFSWAMSVLRANTPCYFTLLAGRGPIPLPTVADSKSSGSEPKLTPDTVAPTDPQGAPQPNVSLPQYSEEEFFARFSIVARAIRKTPFPDFTTAVQCRAEDDAAELFSCGLSHFKKSWGTLTFESPSLDQLVKDPALLARRGEYSALFSLMISYAEFGVEASGETELLEAIAFVQAIEAGATKGTPHMIGAIDSHIGPVLNGLFSEESGGLILKGPREFRATLEELFEIGALFPGREEQAFCCVANCLRIIEGGARQPNGATKRLTDTVGKIHRKVPVIKEYLATFGLNLLPLSFRYYWIAHGGDLVAERYRKRRVLIPEVIPAGQDNGRLLARNAHATQSQVVRSLPPFGWLLNLTEGLFLRPRSFARLKHFACENYASWQEHVLEEAKHGGLPSQSLARYRNSPSDSKQRAIIGALDQWRPPHPIVSGRSRVADWGLKTSFTLDFMSQQMRDSCPNKSDFISWWSDRRKKLFSDSNGNFTLSNFEEPRFLTLSPLEHEIAFHAMGCFNARYPSPALGKLSGRSDFFPDRPSAENVGTERPVVDRLFLLAQIPTTKRPPRRGEILFDEGLLSLAAQPRPLEVKDVRRGFLRDYDEELVSHINLLANAAKLTLSHPPVRVSNALLRVLSRRLDVSLPPLDERFEKALIKVLCAHPLPIRRSSDRQLAMAALLNPLQNKDLFEDLGPLVNRSAPLALRARLAQQVVSAIVDFWNKKRLPADMRATFDELIDVTFCPDLLEKGITSGEANEGFGRMVRDIESTAAAFVRNHGGAGPKGNYPAMYTCLTEGVPLRFMGYVSDTCATRLLHPHFERPNLVFMPFLNRNASLSEPIFLGGTGLLGALSKEGKRCLIIRGFNPRERLLRHIASSALVGGIVTEISRLASLRDPSGNPYFHFVAMPDEQIAGETLSNSPSIVRSLQDLADTRALGMIELLDPESVVFNHLPIRGPLRILFASGAGTDTREQVLNKK